MDTHQTEQYHWKPWGGSVAVNIPSIKKLWRKKILRPPIAMYLKASHNIDFCCHKCLTPSCPHVDVLLSMWAVTTVSFETDKLIYAHKVIMNELLY